MIRRGLGNVEVLLKRSVSFFHNAVLFAFLDFSFSLHRFDFTLQSAVEYLADYFEEYDRVCQTLFPAVLTYNLHKFTADNFTEARFLAMTTAFGGEGTTRKRSREYVAIPHVADEETKTRAAGHRFAAVLPRSFCDEHDIAPGEVVRCSRVHFRPSDETVLIFPETFLKATEGDERTGHVLYAQAEFVVVAAGGKIVFLPLRIHHCDVVDRSRLFEVGDRIDVPGPM
jgi:hypothetical protein